VPAKNQDLHGSVPDSSPVALLLIDVINDLEFREGDRLLEHALPAARRIAALRRRARKLKIPVIYANDNFGRWRSDLGALVRHCRKDGVRGEPIAKLLAPGRDDYFVLKPKHSAFFSTTLDVLLTYLKVKTVILTGFAGNICVLFTADDAHMRDLKLIVPEDCCASNEVAENEHALRQMREVLGADTTPSAELDLERLAGKRKRKARRGRAG
jgi:nicotinamidase-related amidase